MKIGGTNGVPAEIRIEHLLNTKVGLLTLHQSVWFVDLQGNVGNCGERTKSMTITTGQVDSSTSVREVPS